MECAGRPQSPSVSPAGRAPLADSIGGVQAKTGAHASKLADAMKNTADKIHDSMSRMEDGLL